MQKNLPPSPEKLASAEFAKAEGADWPPWAKGQLHRGKWAMNSTWLVVLLLPPLRPTSPPLPLYGIMQIGVIARATDIVMMWLYILLLSITAFPEKNETSTTFLCLFHVFSLTLHLPSTHSFLFPANFLPPHCHCHYSGRTKFFWGGCCFPFFFFTFVPPYCPLIVEVGARWGKRCGKMAFSGVGRLTCFPLTRTPPPRKLSTSSSLADLSL